MPKLREQAIAVARDMLQAALAGIDSLRAMREGEISFRCNVCGRLSKAGMATLGRESCSCRCGSTVRLRALVHLLTRGLFGRSLAIRDIPLRPDLVGIDMSGASLYAKGLAKRLGYTNTFLHKEPRLDITVPGEHWLSTCDFVISSDVFEHVAPPVSVAFENTLRLLKPGGLFVLTVPWVREGHTVEHFPDLADYRIERRDTEAVLVNRAGNGQVREYGNLIFHGGEGETLEMRVFALSGLLDELARAGFCEIRIHGEDYMEFGIVWEHSWSLPITARRPRAEEAAP
jgi:SAM-dependent methyltransferase